jgi:CheY-like chemotaxis protein
MTKEINGRRVLIVDDEVDFREAVAFSFKKLGFETFQASNSSEALNILTDESVGVIITDVCMPGGNGIELLDQIGKRQIDTPVILLVSGYDEISAEVAHRKGASAIFGKPFDRKIMHEAVLRLLNLTEQKTSGGPDWAKVDLKIELYFIVESVGNPIGAKAVNLSCESMSVALGREPYPNVGDNVTFRLTLDARESFCGTGTVRWINTRGSAGSPAGCGIEFNYLTTLQKTLIKDYLTVK